MTAMEKVHDIVENRHQYAIDWKKKTGGKVVGCFCSYVPEELIWAAGALPVRILGSHETQDVADSHIAGIFCPHCRDTLAQGLQGRYDYLDGIVNAHTCIHMNQAFNAWGDHVTKGYNYFFIIPSNFQIPYALSELTHEMGEFKRSLEEWTGKSISQEDLDKAIEVFNTNRGLLREIYDLRKSDPPLLSGLEAMDLTLVNMIMDREECNALLADALMEIKERPSTLQSNIRLMIVGSENDDREYVRYIETLGATIVIDDQCTGTRHFWNDVTPGGDPLMALAERYRNRPRCPLKDGGKRTRFEHMLKLAKEWDVAGVIIGQQKFCDPMGYEIPAMQNMFKKNDIPSMVLELDVTVAQGLVRTRVQAFLEMLDLEAALF